MGIFATLSRRSGAADPEATGRALPDVERMGLPPRFQAVGEALASGSGSTDACAVAGWDLARDGLSLAEALDGLRATYESARGTEPSFEDITALCTAWSESTLGHLHQISCDDPVTGLASLAHVRTRLTELYRGELRGLGAVSERYALVVADLPVHDPWAVPVARLTRSMRLTKLGESARTVFSGGETIGRLGDHRIVVVVERDARLGRRVALLRKMLDQLDVAGHPTRVWIEGLPWSDDGAAMLLTELARR